MNDFLSKKFFLLLFILMGSAAILVGLEIIFGGGDMSTIKKEVKKYISESDSLNTYFGSIKSIYFPRISINGDHKTRENFPGKSKAKINIKGSKKHEDVLFLLEKSKDDIWRVLNFEIQE